MKTFDDLEGPLLTPGENIVTRPVLVISAIAGLVLGPVGARARLARLLQSHV